MKHSKISTQETEEKQKSNEKSIQPAANQEQNSKPSWAVYYLLGSMILGMLLILLKVLGII